uniref:Uncharacterized protein n=1 Tax=Trieres chinensis TaxID=1514140 RepID=A0A7S1ZI65_TRICV
MTTPALSAGCALLAFSPSLSLLFLIAYQKSQLIIIVTTSAFAFLLSSLLASLLWLPVPASLRTGPLIIPPAVVCQFLLRCGFVKVYHRVEAVIQKSIRKHERHEAEQVRRRQEQQRQENNNENHNRAEEGADNVAAPTSAGLSETAKLRLELNDWSCGIAAGNGFGGMHAVLLYGTLLASESSAVGTLYQDSCSFMPSLVNSAIIAFLFSILDMILMLLTFYGMRRRKDGYARNSVNVRPEGSGGASVCAGRIPLLRFPDTAWGGNLALIVAFFAHLAAGFATVPNLKQNGCLVSLPALAGVVGLTAIIFVSGVSGHFLPDIQGRRMGQNGLAAEAMRHED